MAPSIEDLQTAMESVREQAQHPPDRLDLVRRKVRRGARIRLAGAAAATALAVGVAFVLVAPSDRSSGPSATPSPTPSLTGTPATGFRATEQGMQLVLAVKYSVLNQTARLTFTPTGPNSLLIVSCDQEGAIYQLGTGASSCGYSKPGAPPGELNDGAEDYLDTTVGVPISIDLVATRGDAQHSLMDMATLNHYLSKTPRESGGWTAAVYSGTCTSDTCKTMKDIAKNPRGVKYKDPTVGLKMISKSTGTADAQRTPVRTKGHRVVLHLVCDAGPAWAVTWLDGKLSMPIPCEAAESRGVFRSEKPGRLEIAVFPASAAQPTKPTKSDIAKLMKHPDPMGKWTLQVYDHD
jgi:hypothetical protein